MTCVSEGAIDVYVEPFVQARRLFVVGATPVADSLARLARGMNYDVVRVVLGQEQRDIEQDAAALGASVVTLDALETALRDSAAGGADLAAVVASQGHYDEEALETILRCGVPYVGLVASRTRGAAVRAMLEERGVPGVATIRNPAGLDLGARTPPEVALSILAEIVQAHPDGTRMAAAVAADAPPAAAPPAPATAVDPVCGMSVAVASARHTAELDGVTYYFCCAGCRAQVPRRPSRIPGPFMTDAAAIHDRFRERSFIIDEAFATALQIMLALEKPLLVEGPAGVGKTESAKVLAEVLGTELIRLQCYEGPRRDVGALRVELSAPDAPRAPERGGRFQPRRARSVHVQRAFPAQAAAAGCDYARAVTGAAHRRSGSCGRGVRGVSPRGPGRVAGHDPRAGDDPGAAQAARDRHEQPHQGAVRRPAQTLPVPLAAVSVAGAGNRDPARARARPVGSARPADRAADAGVPQAAPAEGARRGREPRLGAGVDEPAPRSPRRAHAGADAGVRAEGARGSRRPDRASRGARADSGRRARRLSTSGGYSLDTDFGFGSVSAPRR